MTSAIEPIAPGERPTEPGWYVIEGKGGREIAEVSDDLSVLVAGYDVPMGLTTFTFIARIYPDRIEGREG